jgi:lysine 2,3-aminomutase
MNCTHEQWNDWKWQLKNRITTVEQLSEIVPLTVEERSNIGLCLEKFRMAISPYYASLIEKENPHCPIRMQAVPSLEELNFSEEDMTDPLNEVEQSPVKNLVHRYPDRVLFLLTYTCAMYCRHCTRKRIVGEEDLPVDLENFEEIIKYISNKKQITDVLISGGDPFTMEDSYLERIISKIREIPHVDTIRIGTRTPVVLPMRITDELVSMLKKYQPIWINTHFNHPNELTKEAQEACLKIVDAGIPLGNQTVLLKGINDDATILKTLFKQLIKNKVRPYYLYQCDLARGIGHFRADVQKGIEIMGKLRGNIPGYSIPTYVIDLPNGGGKVPIGPNYLVSIQQDEIILKNYLGDIYTYPNTN